MSKVTENVVILDRGNYTTCTVHLHGGTIVSYRVKNKEILYLKEKSAFNNVSAIRGGIKFTFPYFGRSLIGPKHGFARHVPWKLKSGPTTLPDGNVEASFFLEDSEFTKAIWNYKFQLSFKITLCMSHLIISIKVENRSSHFPFLFNILGYSIFRVEDVRKVEIFGLSHCQYYDYNVKVVKDPDPNRDSILINRAFMHVFLNASSVLDIGNMDSEGLKVRITMCDSNSPDVLLYNGWKEYEKDDTSIPDDSLHGHEEYLHFIGVGNGFLHTKIRLEPKLSWESQYIIEVLDENYDENAEKLACLLNNPWELFNDKCITKNTS